jgi:hypothetical protein
MVALLSRQADSGQPRADPPPFLFLVHRTVKSAGIRFIHR